MAIWSLPPVLGAGAQAGNYCAPYAFWVFDLDGDKTSDLIATSDCDDLTPLGNSEWWVYTNTGSGFAEQPSIWSMPAVVAAGSPASNYCEPYAFSLLDLDGDKVSELVATSDCDDATPLGRSEWMFYPNTGSGFAEQPQTWSMPAVVDAGSQASNYCEPYTFTVANLDDDARVDLPLCRAPTAPTSRRQRRRALVLSIGPSVVGHRATVLASSERWYLV